MFFVVFKIWNLKCVWCLRWVLLLRLCLQFLIVEMDIESGWREFLYYQIKCLFLVLNDKIWVFSSEILGTISYTEDVFEILFYFIYWYCCDMLFTHNSSASLMRVYWKPFLILSPGARCQCRGSPVPRSQWRTVTDHSGHWWPWHSAAEANLGAGDFGHCVQELCLLSCNR